MNSNQRPTTITASEFVAGNYAGKIARGECVVKVFDYDRIITQRQWCEVRDVEMIDESSGECWIIHEGRSMDTYSDTKLTVSWLPQPATDRDAAAHAEMTAGWQEAEIARLKQVYDQKAREVDEYEWYKEDKLKEAEAEIVRLRAEVAMLQEELKPFADMFAEYQAFNGSKFSSITNFISSDYESGDMWRLLNNINQISTDSEPDHR